MRVKRRDEWDDEGYELEHCPFCASMKVYLYQDYIACERCAARGPMFGDWKMAVLSWNEMPRMSGAALLKQRSHWKSRMSTERKKEKRHEAEIRKEEADRNKVWSEQSKAWVSPRLLDHEHKKWAADRAAWLARPINENDA